MLLWSVAVGGRFRQLFVVVEHLPAILLRLHTDHTQAEYRFLLDRGVGRRRIAVRLADRSVKSFRGFVGVASQKICATIKIQKLRIRRIEWTLNAGRNYLFADVVRQPGTRIVIDLPACSLKFHKRLFSRRSVNGSRRRCRLNFGGEEGNSFLEARARIKRRAE